MAYANNRSSFPFFADLLVAKKARRGVRYISTRAIGLIPVAFHFVTQEIKIHTTALQLGLILSYIGIGLIWSHIQVVHLDVVATLSQLKE